MKKIRAKHKKETKIGQYGIWKGEEKGIYDTRNKLNDLTGKEWLKLTKSIWKSERCADDKIAFEHPAPFLINDISKKPSKLLKNSVDRFYEFFFIQPISLDPYGVVKKIDHVIRNEKTRFVYFINQVAPGADK